MKYSFFFLFLSLFAIQVNAQVYNIDQCDTLRSSYEIPKEYGLRFMGTPLTPDRCHAKGDYDTHPVCLDQSETITRTKHIRILQEVILDGDGCTKTIKEISREEYWVVDDQILLQPIADAWTIQLALMTEMPKSYPTGAYAIRLPQDHPRYGYWQLSFGEFPSRQDANLALKSFQRQYPEFCKAFIAIRPGNGETVWTYKTN